MKGKNAKAVIWIPVGILLFIGLIFGAIGIGFLVDYQDHKQNGAQVTATISHIFEDYSGDDVSYEVYVNYVHNGQFYTNVYLGYHSSSMDVGETVEIYVSNDDATDIVAVESGLFFFIFAIVGVALILAGFIVLLVNKKRQRRHQFLKEMGKKIYATITSIDTNFNIAINNVHPVKLTLTDEYGTTYKSQNLYDFVGQYEVGTKLAVYIDTMDEREYYVDTTDVQTEETPILF